MRTLKSRKLILFFVAILTALTFALGLAGLKFAKADVLVQNYFKYSTGSVATGDMTIDGSSAKIKVYSDKEISARYKLAVNDLAIGLTVPNGAKTLTVNFESDSFYKNGYKTADDTYSKIVKNTLTVKVGANEVIYNGTTNSVNVQKGDDLAVKTSIDGNVLKVVLSVNGTDYTLNGADLTDAKYYVDITDKTTATVSFGVELDDGVTDETLKVNYVNQKASLGNDFATNAFYQDFTVEAGGIKNHAECVLDINADLFAIDYSNGKLVAEIGRMYAISVDGTNLFGNFNQSVYTLSTDSVNAVVDNKTVVFTTVGDCKLTLKNADKVVEEYTVTVVDESNDDKAPVYVTGANAEAGIDAFKNALNDLLYDEEGNTKVSIGSSQYLTLNKNMFKNFVYDDYTGFDGLTAKIYYKSETKSGDVSNFKIPLREAGRYQFYVTFTDHNGNEMSADNFYYADNEDPNKLIDGIYADYVFTFDIVDTSNLDITAYEMGKGYVGAQYNAVPFKVDATFDHTDTYKLYYTTTTDKTALESAEWTEITKMSSATSEDKDYNGYTYEEIRAIAYDGKLSFVPDKVGFYKIEMQVSSSSSTKKGTESVIIEVVEPVKEVKVGKTWIEENVWSVVYLSVGTVCLIAILVLLFIKPKEEDDIDNI